MRLYLHISTGSKDVPINEMCFNISNDIPRIRASICVVHSTGAEFLGRRVAWTIVEPAPNSQVCLIMCDYSTCSKPSILLTLLLWPQTVFLIGGMVSKL